MFFWLMFCGAALSHTVMLLRIESLLVKSAGFVGTYTNLQIAPVPGGLLMDLPEIHLRFLELHSGLLEKRYGAVAVMVSDNSLGIINACISYLCACCLITYKWHWSGQYLNFKPDNLSHVWNIYAIISQHSLVAHWRMYRREGLANFQL